jgi:hypothetical protein
MSAAQSFISDLFNSTNQEVLYSIPNKFIEQARNGYDSFYIDTTIMSRSAYTREDGSHDLFRFVLVDPVLYENAVSVKAHISGIMDADGEMVPLTNGASLKKGQAYLKGFRSTPIIFTPESVTNGVLSATDYESLCTYAEMWEAITLEDGTNAMYTKEHGKKRLWVVASDHSGLITFDMVERLNPSTKTPTIGISNVAWTNCHLIGVGTGQSQGQVAKAPAKAPSPTSKKASFPELDRSKAVTSVTRRRRR